MKKFFVRSDGKQFLYTGLLLLGILLVGNPFYSASGSPLASPSMSGEGNLILVDGGTLNNLGTLVILGNLTNNGTTSLGTGTVKLTGSTNQSVSGTNTFQNLEVNNSSGISINGPTTVNGALTLTNGIVTLADNNLLLGTSSTIAGTPDAGKMIVTTGTGQVQKQFSGNGSFTYPVGDNTGTAEYSPVTLSFMSGSFNAGSWAGVKVTNSSYPGSADSYLNRYWDVASSGISTFNCDAQFSYVAPADVVGTESSITCAKVHPEPVEFYGAANTTLHQVGATGLSSFGTFTGRLGFRSLNISSLMLEGLYDGSNLMRKASDEFGEHFGGDTADVINVELHKASDYSSIKYTAPNVRLNTSGIATVSVPAGYNEWYYVTIKHRNSVETTTADSVLLSSPAIAYAFNTPDKAYGNNMGMMIDGTAVILSGDSNQDGIVDGTDLSDIENLATNGVAGYLPEDLSGDGLVDGTDLSLAGNNAALGIGIIIP